MQIAWNVWVSNEAWRGKVQRTEFTIDFSSRREKPDGPGLRFLRLNLSHTKPYRDSHEHNPSPSLPYPYFSL